MSRGLARGILVSIDGRSIAGEGMGIGAVALKDSRFSYFSRNCNTIVYTPNLIKKTFFIDSRMVWGVAGYASIPLTWCLERINEAYMRLPGLQILLGPGSQIKRILGLKPVFEPIPPIAVSQFIYRMDNNRIDVSCTICPLIGQLPSVFILNELAADTFTRTFSNGEAMKAPPGWIRHEAENDFYDPEHRIRFIFPQESLRVSTPSRVWWGREYTRTLRWAGYSIEFPDSHSAMTSISCSYSVLFNEESHVGGD